MLFAATASFSASTAFIIDREYFATTVTVALEAIVAVVAAAADIGKGSVGIKESVV